MGEKPFNTKTHKLPESGGLNAVPDTIKSVPQQKPFNVKLRDVKFVWVNGDDG